MQRDVVFAHALDAGEGDIILLAFVHHIAPQPHGIIGDVSQGHGKHGKYPRFPVIDVKDQANAQQLRAVKLNEQIIDRGRNRLDKDDKRRSQVIEELALILRHQRAHRNADEHCKEQRKRAEFDRNGELRPKDFGDGNVVDRHQVS